MDYTKMDIKLFEESDNFFTDHLEIPENERIIFSAPFGMGKTSFLYWYFDKDEVKKKYNAIHLFPVNYSVATNEDIFRYVKYDIIIELLKKGYKVEENTLKQNDILKAYFKKNVTKLVAAIINMIPVIGKDVINAYDRFLPIIESFNEIEKKLSSEANPSDHLINYIEEIEKTEGNFFENGIITKIIEDILNQNKQGEGNKQNILIIDDLDRIDPEHIFRLLNVFAAHFDMSNQINTKNKFGFDKVIFVCDIKNIREIFRSKFGMKVDFNGYIDKFFSSTVFKFNHVSHYIRFVTNRLYNINLIDSYEEELPILTANRDQPFLEILLKTLIQARVFDLRNVVKWSTRHLKYEPSYQIENIYQVNIYDHAPILALKFLHDIKGDVEGLRSAITQLKSNKVVIEDRQIKYLCGPLVLLLCYKYDDRNLRYTYSIHNEELTFIYEDRFRNRYIEKVALYNISGEVVKEINLNKHHLTILLEDVISLMEDNQIF